MCPLLYICYTSVNTSHIFTRPSGPRSRTWRRTWRAGRWAGRAGAALPALDAPPEPSAGRAGPLAHRAPTEPSRHLPRGRGPAASSAPPACSGAAPRNEPARGCGPSRVAAVKPSAAEATRDPPVTPGPARAGPAPPPLRTEPRGQAKHRTPGSAAPPDPLRPASSQEPQQQNGGRGRSGQPPPPPLSALRLRTRGRRLPAAAGASR